MEMLSKAVKIITSPTEFFKTLKEKGIKEALQFFLLWLFISTVLAAIVGALTSQFVQSLAQQITGMPLEIEPHTRILSLIWGYIFGIIAIFIWTGLLHVYLLIFQVKATFEKTFQLAVYSMTPKLVFGWVPIAAMLLGIWDLVLLIIGTIRMYKVRKQKAVLMYVIPIAILFVLGVLLSLFAAAGFMMYLSNVQ